MYPLLEGVRILDMAALIPGGTATSVLAGLGAEVIKVEAPPVGDYLRDLEALRHSERISGQHLTLNRNKRSLTLNLRAEGGRDLFYDLLRTADVVFDVSVPGAREALGVDFAACQKVNPAVVYMSLTAYGYTGKYTRFPAHGVGPEVLTGEIRPQRRDDGGLTFDLPEIRVPAAGSALWAAIGILAALRYRDRTGRGIWLETSQVDAAIWWRQLVVFRELNELQVEKPAVTGAGAARYNFYECADGEPLLIMPIEKKFWQRFCTAIERPDLSERGEWVGGSLDFGGGDEELEGEIAMELRKRPRDEWLEIFGTADVPVMAAMTLAQLVRDEEYMEQRQALLEYDHERVGPVRLAAFPLKAAGLDPVPTRGAPDLGVDTRDILSELGYDESKIDELYASGVLFGD